MGDERMGTTNLQRPQADDKTVEELRLIRAELAALRRMFFDFGRTYLAAKFPFGKPTDRWAPR
jgi:hypothetical protein